MIYRICGGRSLEGKVSVEGSKNAALSLMAASLLSDECVLMNAPLITDTTIMSEVMDHIGASVEWRNNKVIISKSNSLLTNIKYNLVRELRASILLMGPLLATEHRVIIPLPGGCVIGARPINLHLKGLELLGAKITATRGYVKVMADKLIGNRIYLDFPSVGATQNIMMASTLAKGETIIENAACEPEVVELSRYLKKMGAQIEGIGSPTLRITGVKELNGVEHMLIPDRIEAGTYMIASAVTNGNVKIKGVIPEHLDSVISKLREMGIGVSSTQNEIYIKGTDKIAPASVKTLPYPGFPTDLQPVIMSLMSIASGTSVITETIFENRFIHVPELNRLGANIVVENHEAIIRGVNKLMGCRVEATDLRGGASLVIAGLAARGKTDISNIQHIDRGYFCMEKKLNELGADVERL